MVQFIHAKDRKEANIKIVYYGPGMSGKTTNLEVVFRDVPRTHRGELALINTDSDRTLFFDFLPVFLGKIFRGDDYLDIKLRLFTVPGQTYYAATRKLLLSDADGIIFVADSQAKKYGENCESLRDLHNNLRESGVSPESIPLVFQWNKRDLPNISTVEELQRLNVTGAPAFEAVACQKKGVLKTLKKCSEMVIDVIKRGKK